MFARLSTCLAVGLLALPAGAQEPLSAGDKSVANFAFATQLGSGIYTIDGRTVQIYRIPLSYSVRPETENRWGLRITFPLTVGFYDFKPMDVVDTGIPDSLDTVSLVPGLEFRIPVGGNLLVKPFFEGGIAREGATDTTAYVFSGGLRTFARFRSGRFDLDLGNGLLYAGVDPDGGTADDFAAFDTAVQARHGMGVDLWNRELEWGLYASIEIYLDQPDFPLPADGAWSISDQYEVGATLGPKEPWKLWKIKLPKLGIGYRFGSDTSAIRFVIGTPVPVLKR